MKTLTTDTMEPRQSKEKATTQTKTGVDCKFCGQYFASKNLVFRHLRDTSSSCGKAITANGEKLPDAPSTIAKRERQEAARALRRKKTGKAKQRADPASTLWFGDLPIPYTRLGGQYRVLRAALREYLPRDVPQPWLKKVVRKAYRKGGNEEENKRGDCFGYAIVVFRDEEEANNVKIAMDGIEIKTERVFPAEYDSTGITPSFILKVKHFQHNNDKKKEQNVNLPVICGGKDPPLIDQLRPLSTPELRERCQYLRKRIEASETRLVPDKGRDKEGSEILIHQEHDKALQKTIALYSAISVPREEVFHKGCLIPESIRENLLTLLKNVRWPAETHRKGLTSDHYLVLQTNATSDRFYNNLRIGCRELMDWADADYYYSGIAVTKNFVASPHIDDRDRTFQYAVSLGNFKGGGELCVEGKHDDNADYVNVVETKNRIVRVDGRNVHWVRSWDSDSGDRYSLIFYDTTDRHQSDIIRSGIDSTYLAQDL